MNIVVNSILNIFVIKNSKIYLITENNDLIKINCNDEIDVLNQKYLNENFKISNLDLKQCYTFSNKKDNILELDILYFDVINYNSISLSKSYDIIEIEKLDKNNKYVVKSIEYLKKYLVLGSTVKRLYPNEFILPEIQKIYESLLNKKYDRRNFRKKLIKLDIIENVDKNLIGETGRPAKIYRFKEIKEDKALL